MNRHHTISASDSDLSSCLANTGMGENFLALDGLELEIPLHTFTSDETSATLWDDNYDEDIAALIKSSRAYQ